jgi:hypothetical protein
MQHGWGNKKCLETVTLSSGKFFSFTTFPYLLLRQPLSFVALGICLPTSVMSFDLLGAKLY